MEAGKGRLYIVTSRQKLLRMNDDDEERETMTKTMTKTITKTTKINTMTKTNGKWRLYIVTSRQKLLRMNDEDEEREAEEPCFLLLFVE